MNAVRRPRPAAAAPVGGKVNPNSRKADLAAIHIGAQRLQWNRSEYEDIMATVCGGIRSAGDLDHSGRKRFLSHIASCMRASGLDTRGVERPYSDAAPLSAKQALMWSLWMRLVDRGLADQRTMAALNAFCLRQTKVHRIQWLNREQEDLLIDSLKGWLQRGGVADGAQG